MSDAELAMFNDLAATLRIPGGHWDAVHPMYIVAESIAIERRAERLARERGISQHAAREAACATLGVRPRSYAERLRLWYTRALRRSG